MGLLAPIVSDVGERSWFARSGGREQVTGEPGGIREAQKCLMTPQSAQLGSGRQNLAMTLIDGFVGTNCE